MNLNWESRVNLVKAMFRAGEVKRYHTTVLLGEQTNATHCYGVASLILALHPAPSVNLIMAALWHEAAEFYVGDMPYPAKRDFKELNLQLDSAERSVIQKLGLDFEDRLTYEEKRWIASCDRFEAWMFARNQMRLGNSRARAILYNMVASFNRTPLVDEVRRLWDDMRDAQPDDCRYQDDDDKDLLQKEIS